MRKYVESISKITTLALSMDEPEVNRFSSSDTHWAINKSAHRNAKGIKKGDVYQFEFGKNYSPELAYEHRGVVIGVSGDLLYVLPIFSYNSSKSEHRNASHYIDNPKGRNEYYLIKRSEFSFLKRDSIIKVNDIKTVSPSRIKYPYKDKIDPTSDIYKFIENKAFYSCFGSIAYDYNRLKEENNKLKEELENIKKTGEEI